VGPGGSEEQPRGHGALDEDEGPFKALAGDITRDAQTDEAEVVAKMARMSETVQACKA
jgi:hypothetical protein